MRLSEAIEGVREYIGDLGEENWTDSRITRAIQAAIRKIHAKALRVNPEWGIQAIQITPDDLVTTDEGQVYTLPYYVAEVWKVKRGVDGWRDYPFLQLNEQDSSIEGWRRSLTTPRGIVLIGSTSDTYATVDSPADYFWIQYRKKIADQFKGESGNTSPATSTANWKAQTITLGKITEGPDVYAGERIACNHNGLWTEGHVLSNTAPVDNVSTFTVDAAATIEEKDTIETLLPWKGLLDDPVVVVAAFTILAWEGHRRGMDALAALYAEAMEQVEGVVGDIGKQHSSVEIVW